MVPHHLRVLILFLVLLLSRLVRADGIIFRAGGLRSRPFGRSSSWPLAALLGTGLARWTLVRHGVGLLGD